MERKSLDLDGLTLRQLRQEFEFVSLLSLQHPDNPHWSALADSIERKIMEIKASAIMAERGQK